MIVAQVQVVEYERHLIDRKCRKSSGSFQDSVPVLESCLDTGTQVEYRSSHFRGSGSNGTMRDLNVSRTLETISRDYSPGPFPCACHVCQGGKGHPSMVSTPNLTGKSPGFYALFGMRKRLLASAHKIKIQSEL